MVVDLVKARTSILGCRRICFNIKTSPLRVEKSEMNKSIYVEFVHYTLLGYSYLHVLVVNYTAITHSGNSNPRCRQCVIRVGLI